MPVASPSLVDRELLRLAGLRFVPADMTGHREVLADVVPDDLTAAVSLAQRECREFPTPAELLDLVHRVRMTRVASTPTPIVERPIEPVEIPIPHTGRTVQVDREYEHECDLCDDSGWRPCWCGPRDAMPGILKLRGAQFTDCGRQRRDHAPHEFVVGCPCRVYNRTYQRGRDVLAAGARKREAT